MPDTLYAAQYVDLVGTVIERDFGNHGRLTGVLQLGRPRADCGDSKPVETSEDRQLL